MKAIPHTALYHKIIEPRQTVAGKPPVLVLMHGRGANENDLLELSDYLDERFFLISVRAPNAFPGGTGYSWYELEDIGKPVQSEFADSFQKLRSFLDEIVTLYPIDPSKIFLFGFSMGAIMSLALSLTEPGRVAGVVANSGFVPEESELQFQWDQVKGRPFFVAHGLYDPVIPVEYGRRSAELLRKAQADLTYREYEMGHQIGEESLNDLMQWLSHHLGR